MLFVSMFTTAELKKKTTKKTFYHFLTTKRTIFWLLVLYLWILKENTT